MKFKITVCTRTWAEEDCGYGDPLSSETEDLEPTTFKDLVEYLRNYSIDSASCFPVRPGDHFWISAYPETNIRSGYHTDVSFHLKAKDDRSLRYWYKAFQASK